MRRELCGNASEHICIYHQWCYGLDGRLTAIPFRRGIRGKGGLDPGFDMAEHGLRALRVGDVDGLIFGTLSTEAPSRSKIIWGRRSWRNCAASSTGRCRSSATTGSASAGNWKLYAENTRDNYHASLLHEFLVTFGLDRSTQVGGVKMDARHRHNITWAEAGSDTRRIRPRRPTPAPACATISCRCRSRTLVAFHPERDDRLNIAITSVFP